ncbi:MAG TPA: HD domain-containing phosphohydrolase [Verrucomicrobiae bacterium]
MSEKILFVDDDPNLLAACERSFRRRFQLDTAEGGEAGLAKIAERGPYAVVISDRQMPGMDGIQFLSQVRQRVPDTVRIMLTGNVDLEHAVRVVNEGSIFRFLIKPCPQEVLSKALEDGLAQFQLIQAEKELLNKTLSGSVKLLTDILSMVDVRSFGRTEKLRGMINEVVEKMSVTNPWELHVAAMLAPIGYVTLPAETMVKARASHALSKVEEQMVANVPEIAARLLNNIPRLEGVAKIVHYQNKRFDGTGFPPDDVKEEAIPVGARLLKILSDLAQLESEGALPLRALSEMQHRNGCYDPKLLAEVRACFGGPDANAEAVKETVAVMVRDLNVGMVLHTNVLTKDGTLVLAAGHQINEMSLEKIQNFEQLSGIQEPIFVEVAK